MVSGRIQEPNRQVLFRNRGLATKAKVTWGDFGKVRVMVGWEASCTWRMGSQDLDTWLVTPIYKA